MKAFGETEAWPEVSRSWWQATPVSVEVTGLTAKSLGFSLELSAYSIKKVSSLSTLGLAQTSSWISPTFLEGMLAQKHRGNLRQSPSMWKEQGEIWGGGISFPYEGDSKSRQQVKENRWVGGFHHHSSPFITIATSPAILQDRSYIFLFTCHSSWYCHSLSPLLAGGELWLFHPPDKLPSFSGVQLLWNRRMGYPEGCSEDSNSISPLSLITAGKCVAVKCE